MLLIITLGVLITLSLIALLISNIDTIKAARLYGVKLEKKSMFYALLTRTFIKDLPN